MSLETTYNKPTLLQKFTRPDYIFVYASLLIASVLFVLLVFYGSGTPWYEDLINDGPNPWIVRSLWVIAGIISYVGLYFLWDIIQSEFIPRDLVISVLYLISTFLLIAWAAIFYYTEHIGLALWASVVLVVYNFWVLIYIWYLKPLSAIFMLPSLVMYIYLMWSTGHLAYINGSPI